MDNIPRLESIPRIRRELVTRFEILVRARAAALGIGGFKDWVDGIVGEGIATAIAHQDQWQPKKGDFLYWSFLKTRSLVRKELENERRYRRTIRKMEAMAPNRVDYNTDELREELAEILSQLTLTEQKALALYYLNGMTVGSLGEILGKKPKAVYALLNQARHKVLKRYESGTPQALEVAPKPALPSEGSEDDASGERERKRLEQERAIDRLFGL